MIPYDAPSHTSLIPFTYQNQSVRTAQHADGTTWWVAADVCAVLEIRNVSQVCKRLDADEKDAICFSDSVGRQQELLIVNEPGLYKILLRSNKPESKAFQHWVFHEVLPQIRKTGSYGQTPTPTVHNQEIQVLIDTLVRLDRTEQLAIRADATATRAEDKADLALAEIRVMTLEEFVMANGLLRQLPKSHWQSYAHCLREFCQVHGLSVRKDPVPGRPWNGENAYPITALGALLHYEQTRPRQVALIHPRRIEL